MHTAAGRRRAGQASSAFAAAPAYRKTQVASTTYCAKSSCAAAYGRAPGRKRPRSQPAPRTPLCSRRGPGPPRRKRAPPLQAHDFSEGPPLSGARGAVPKRFCIKLPPAPVRKGGQTQLLLSRKAAGRVIRPAFRQEGCAARPCRRAKLLKIFRGAGGGLPCAQPVCAAKKRACPFVRPCRPAPFQANSRFRAACARRRPGTCPDI